MSKNSIGDRIKTYEDVSRYYLPSRMPVILKFDGNHFSSFLKGCNKPFDENVNDVMGEVATFLCKNVQNAAIAYTQSDEISVLLTPYKKLNTEDWFGNNISKMCSVGAGMASAHFSFLSEKIFGKYKMATFDCRAFILPKEEVNNYFYWRQLDCARNSIQMLAQSLFSPKQLHGKHSDQLKQMCKDAGYNWDDKPHPFKYGRCAIKKQATKSFVNKRTQEVGEAVRSEWIIDDNIPIFSKEPEYINKLVFK